MVVDGATEVGCSISQYYKNGRYNTLFACNYSKANIIGTKIYVSGPAASQCKNRNRFYPALCSIGEPINPNSLNI